MTDYQKKKIAELTALGWKEEGKEFLSGPGRGGNDNLYKLSSGCRKAFIYTNWVQYIN